VCNHARQIDDGLRRRPHLTDILDNGAHFAGSGFDRILLGTCATNGGPCIGDISLRFGHSRHRRTGRRLAHQINRRQGCRKRRRSGIHQRDRHGLIRASSRAERQFQRTAVSIRIPRQEANAVELRR